MATQTVEFPAPTGKTLTAKLFSVGADTVVATSTGCTEGTNRKTEYSAAFTDVPAGVYQLKAFDAGGLVKSSRFVTLTLATATFASREEPGGVTEIQSGLALATALATAQTSIDDLPTNAELATALAASDVAAAFATVNATLATIAGYVDSEIASIKLIVDHLGTAIELDGSAYRFTVAALAQAPAGGGGSGATQESVDELAAEVAKIPRVGTTHHYTNMGTGAAANVAIAEVS